MANTGLKISQLVYTSLEDAINDAAQVPLAIDVSDVKTNKRIPIEELKGYQGYQGSQGSQGYQGVAGDSAGPAGLSGQVQYNNNTVLGGAPLTYTTGNSGSWYYNRFTFDRPSPTSDTETTGITRMSYLNGVELMLWAGGSVSTSIELCSDDTSNRTTFGIFNSGRVHLRNFSATYSIGNINVDDYPSSDIVTGGAIIMLTGTTVTSANLLLNSLVTSSDNSYQNEVVKIVNHSVADISFYGFTIATNTTCDFLWLGNGGVGNTVFTLLGRYSNI